ncbi:MAG: MBL fold metallo-hydrolase [Actinomycetota bacterium]|nr:MBL fold metallo-hydrolase [Actinomycetota bacterium]
MPGSSLMQRFSRLEPGSSQIALWWLGQAGFVYRGAGVTALLDPFLAPHEGRRFERMLPPDQATGVDLILCSHEHIDHFDAESIPALAAASPEARVVVPTPIVSMVTDLGIDGSRVIGAQPDDPIEIDGLRIHPVPARHGVEISDAYTFGTELSDGLVRYLGFVLESDGVRLYHAGDTILYDGMAEGLRSIGVDIALLPINGRDGFRESRGLVGNLTEHEAALLSRDMGADLLIPIHYEMFAHNRGYPARVLETIDREELDVSVLVPIRQEPFVLTSAVRKT